VLPEKSIVNITENIGFSVVSVEMQMFSDMDLVTFGLCVHAATTAAEQSSYYTILTSQFCSSSTHTGSVIWSFICVQLHRYIITLSGNRYDVTDTNITAEFDCKFSGVHDFVNYSHKIHFTIIISNQSRFLGAFAKLRKTTSSFVMFVFRSIRMEQLCSHRTDFHEKWIFSIFQISYQQNSNLINIW